MRVADGPIAAALAQLSDLPAAGIHALLGVGAFVENVFPPVPADTFIGAGGVLAAAGAINPFVGFLIVWAMNVLGAVWVYRIGLRHGASAFASPLGRFVMDEDQLTRLRAFYERRGVPAIFFARFLPGLRAVVPAFAGVAGLKPARVVPPLIGASLMWYGAIFGLGLWAGENVEAVDGMLRSANRLLWIAALITAGVIAWFWRRSRHRSSARSTLDREKPSSGHDPDQGEG